MKKEVTNKKEVNKSLNKKLLLSAIFAFLFILLTILVLTKVTDPIDLWVESFIIGIRNDNLTKIMQILTNIGSAYSLIVITILIILFAIIKNKRVPLNTITNLVAVFLTSQLFKVIIRRSRPTGLFLVNATGYSYPSGHTMVSFAYFTFIAISLCERINNKLVKVIIKVLTTLLVLLIGFSRIYLGVHHLTDVIAGYVLGLSYLMLFLNIREKNNKKKELKEKRVKK